MPVHEPVSNVDDEEFLGGAGVEYEGPARISDRPREADPSAGGRRGWSDGPSMAAHDDEDLGVSGQHDGARNYVRHGHLHERHASLLAADRRHQNVPAETPLDRRPKTNWTKTAHITHGYIRSCVDTLAIHISMLLWTAHWAH